MESLSVFLKLPGTRSNLSTLEHKICLISFLLGSLSIFRRQLSYPFISPLNKQGGFFICSLYSLVLGLFTLLVILPEIYLIVYLTFKKWNLEVTTELQVWSEQHIVQDENVALCYRLFTFIRVRVGSIFCGLMVSDQLLTETLKALKKCQLPLYQISPLHVLQDFRTQILDC